VARAAAWEQWFSAVAEAQPAVGQVVGPMARIAVARAVAASNIFKPYVTMRPKGAGLGLAIVQQIVAAHRWDLVCLANSPRGAVFRISHLRTASAVT
jgi:hypothetical protein